MARPPQELPPPNLSLALESIAHWEELFTDKGKEARELIAFAKGKGGRTEERRMRPETRGPLLREILDAGFTIAVDEEWNPSITRRARSITTTENRTP